MHEKQSSGFKVPRGCIAVYAVVALLALLVVPASLYGVAGIEQDPLSGIFALLMGLPWTLSLYFFEEPGMWSTLAVCAIGMLLNLAIFLRLSRSKKGT